MSTDKNAQTSAERIVEALPGGVLLLSGSGSLQPVNRRGGEILRLLSLNRVDSQPRWAMVARHVFESPSDFLEIDVAGADDETAFHMILSVMDHDTIVVFARDNSEQISRERQRARYIDKIAHDLRTPLTTAMLTVDLVATSPSLCTESREGLVVVREQLGQEKDIVEDLLAATRLESGKIDLNPGPMDLSPLLTQAINTLKTEAESKGLDFVDEISPEVPQVWGDYGAVQKALSDVIGHAIQSTPEGGEVRLMMRMAPDGVLVRVSDNGKPLCKEDLPFFFDLFQNRVDAPPDLRRGGGVGLFRTKATLEGLGGWAHVSSDGARGVEVELYFPLYTDDPTRN